MYSGNNGLFDHGVTFISDLMNSNGKFLTFEEVQNKFEIKANYLYYSQLIAAIPPDLKRKVFGSSVPDLLGATSEYCQIEDRTIFFTKFRCKNYREIIIIIKRQKQTKIETNLVGRKTRRFNSGGENMRYSSGHQDKNERK